MNDFHKWKPLRHDNILPLCGITYGFGPVPAILADVAAGLQYVHSKNVAHADLTGSNVLINRDGRALVADYGLLTTCSDLNGTSYIRSNMRWTAPELSISPKLESDIYSFGCITYQVLSGEQPYCNICSDHQVVVAILRGVKAKRPVVPVIEDCHWNLIEQRWAELSQRPSTPRCSHRYGVAEHGGLEKNE
ncbi:hypothetical protein CY34DRAFT_26385 [Suillus luteus UH-Slu-Lm8-n1]|uniref:Protein kinase domain-containing protein n=1 Tax=Suillus luteus UH-Slu-Lm8-n1 TaxID=930992 RepID=A0A0D0APL5_9AGAM|nr:hypothetical protein CY34DRAFT_26385 [Suillus luteus UH-Slu-Lm8-n1]